MFGKRVLLAGCAVAISAAVLSLAQGADQPTTKPAEEDRQKLLARIEKLEKENMQLIKELAAARAQIMLKRDLSPLPSEKPNVPRGAVPKEFNGITYYVVPLETGQ